MSINITYKNTEHNSLIMAEDIFAKYKYRYTNFLLIITKTRTFKTKWFVMTVKLNGAF